MLEVAEQFHHIVGGASHVVKHGVDVLVDFFVEIHIALLLTQENLADAKSAVGNRLYF